MLWAAVQSGNHSTWVLSGFWLVCHTHFHWDLVSLQVCIPLIQSTLTVDSSAALQGTPSRVPSNPSLANPPQKPGMEGQACFTCILNVGAGGVLCNICAFSFDLLLRWACRHLQTWWFTLVKIEAVAGSIPCLQNHAHQTVCPQFALTFAKELWVETLLFVLLSAPFLSQSQFWDVFSTISE